MSQRRQQRAARAMDAQSYLLPEPNHIELTTPAAAMRMESLRHTEYEMDDGGFSLNRIFYDVPADVSELEDNTIPLPDNFLSVAWMDPDFDTGIGEFLEENSASARRSLNSDNPLLAWLPYKDIFLEELLRHEGLPPDPGPCCAASLQDGSEARRFQCQDCLDLRRYCAACTITRHQVNPFHRIKEWIGLHLSPVTLKGLGLRIQVGHPFGDACRNPARAHDDFVVIALNGTHAVALDFCNCEIAETRPVQLLRARLYPATVIDPRTAATFEVLSFFQLLSFTSKISGYDFMNTLARRTNNLGQVVSSYQDARATLDSGAPQPAHERYKPFMRMMRQWRHLRMLKRAGRGHQPGGADATKPGECAILCPACPQPGKNLRPGWENVSDDKKWLNALFIGIDANFRLKRLDVSTDERDPGLSQGYAYIVNESEFKKHLITYDPRVSEEFSTCNNHDAIKSAASRGGKGIAASGLGTVECSRHDMKRPVSLGDLQKGERYVNMDFLFLSSLRHNTPQRVVVSYDIACQWSRKLSKRVNTYSLSFPDHIFNSLDIEYLVPKFHLPAHRLDCQLNYSFNLAPGVGRTDGEAPERGWASLNPLANSTKEMGPGSRRDTLDDHIGDYNWRKVTTMYATMLRRVKDAVPEREEHVAAFLAMCLSLGRDVCHEWTTLVQTWERDPTAPNPYEPSVREITEHKIRLQLAEEDTKAMAAENAIIVHDDVSPGVLIAQALELEQQQADLRADFAALGQHPTDLQQAKLLERRNRLHRRITTWFSAQQLYTPLVTVLRARDGAFNDGTVAEELPLLLPSATVAHTRFLSQSTSHSQLVDYEWRLRYAQAFDTLDTIRGHILCLKQMYRSKDRQGNGQRYLTRSANLLKRVRVKLWAAVARYRVVYVALVALAPYSKAVTAGWDGILKPLLDADVRDISQGEQIGSSEGRRTIAWIWIARAPGENRTVNESMHEAKRIEWCKLRARAHRWQEECVLLAEEMRRVTMFFSWEVGRWLELAESGTSEGQRAYAMRQANIRSQLNAQCEDSWHDAWSYLEMGEGVSDGATFVEYETAFIPDPNE